MLKSVQGITLLFNVAVKDLTPESAEKALASDLRVPTFTSCPLIYCAVAKGRLGMQEQRSDHMIPSSG